MFSYSYENLVRIANTEQGKAWLNKVEEGYKERFQGKPIYALEYSQFKRFYIDGDRTSYQSQYFARRTRLAMLQVLALVKDEYLSDLEDILSAICEEFTWVLPAHAFEDGVVAKYEMVDLFSAETAFYLAETCYVYGDRLSEDIRNRVKVSIKLKLTDIFENGHYYFEDTHSNWAGVCGAGVGLAYLYLFPDRFPLVKERIFTCMEHYLLGLSEDGYCEEGMNYWQYGFGFFVLFFDVYTQLTGERPAILQSKTVQNTLRYPENARLDKLVYLPYADGGSTQFVCSPSEMYAIKNLFGDAFTIPPINDRVDGKPLYFRLLNGIDKFGGYEEKSREVGTVYYAEKEVFIRKEKAFSVTVKCGTNYELHNHNDVGSFQIVSDGKRLIADLGAGEYTKDYFRNPEVRFGEEVFACGSMSHSVPIVDGKYQRYARPHQGKVLSQSEKEIVMDLAGAYEANAEGVLAKYRVDENGVYITYRNTQGKPACYRFVSEYEPKLQGGQVWIEGLQIVCKNALAPTLTSRTYNGISGVLKKAYLVDYIVEATDEEIKFEFLVK